MRRQSTAWARPQPQPPRPSADTSVERAGRGLTALHRPTYDAGMDAAAHPALARLVARAERDPDVLAVLLFGSRARV